MKTSASIPSLLSRRTFLRGIASGSLVALSPQWLRSQNTANRGAILYVTDALEKHAERPPLGWTRAAAGAPRNHYRDRQHSRVSDHPRLWRRPYGSFLLFVAEHAGCGPLCVLDTRLILTPG